MNTLHTPSILAHIIASTSGACRINTKALRPWLDKTNNPVSVNMRLLQSIPEARTLIAKGLYDLLQPGHIRDATHVYGTPSASIVPATLLALKLGKPLLIRHNDAFFEINLTSLQALVSEKQNIDSVTGIIPFGIPLAVCIAEAWKTSLLSARILGPGGTLTHNRNPLEGIIVKNATTLLVAPHSEIGHLNHAEKTDIIGVLKRKDLMLSGTWDGNINKEVRPLETLAGIHPIIVKDSISTGYKILKELDLLKTYNVSPVGIVSIFNYYFQTTKDKFLEKGISVRSIVSFEQVLRLKALYGLCATDEATVKEWHADRSAWTKAHADKSAVVED